MRAKMRKAMKRLSIENSPSHLGRTKARRTARPRMETETVTAKQAARKK
jgi:hypothetical protein